MYVHIKLPGQVSMAFSSEFRRSPTSEILYHIVYLPLSKGGCGKCMNTDTAKSDATKKSENAAKDVYVPCPLMAPLFSRIDVKGNDHLDFLKPCCMIGYHCHHQTPSPLTEGLGNTPWGPQRQGDALMDPGTLSRKISIFLHLGKHPTEESCGRNLEKIPNKKKGWNLHKLVSCPQKDAKK